MSLLGNVSITNNLSVTGGILVTNRGVGIGNNTVNGLVQGDINVSTLHVSVTRTKSPEVVITGQYNNGTYQPSLKCVVADTGAWVGIEWIVDKGTVKDKFTLNDVRCTSKITAYENEIIKVKEAEKQEDCEKTEGSWNKVTQECTIIKAG
jgi:hypothetical protein